MQRTGTATFGARYEPETGFQKFGVSMPQEPIVRSFQELHQDLSPFDPNDRIIAVNGDARFRSLPNIPTVAEQLTEVSTAT